MEFDIKRYYQIILKRIWVVILLPIIAVATTGYISIYKLKPVYEANATLYVLFQADGASGKGISYNDVLIADSLVKDYKELVKSRSVLQKVVQDLVLNNENKYRRLTVENVAGKVSVDLKSDSRVINIRVRDNDPETAKAIANEVSGVFIDSMSLLTQSDSVKSIDKADTPLRPISPNKTLNIAMALFLGIVFSLALTFIIEYVDSTMKTPEEIERRLGLSVLGIIPEFKQK